MRKIAARAEGRGAVKHICRVHAMPEVGGPDTEKESKHAVAKRIGDTIAPLVELARQTRLNFLAYLLGMALKESRRLSEDQGGR